MKVGDLVKVHWYHPNEAGFGILIKELNDEPYNEPRWEVLYENELWNINYRNLEVLDETR